MTGPDLILMHPPSVFRFRELPLFFGPVSDVVPSSSIFEIYPIGFLTIGAPQERGGKYSSPCGVSGIGGGARAKSTLGRWCNWTGLFTTGSSAGMGCATVCFR